mgnify:CR=1 FL=1
MKINNDIKNIQNNINYKFLYIPSNLILKNRDIIVNEEDSRVDNVINQHNSLE